MDGLILAATASGSGKTIIGLGVLAALKQQGVSVAAAKIGPDYIDPGFHSMALGDQQACVNLDAFAMGTGLLRRLATDGAADIRIIEGVMGVMDGGVASTAQVATRLSLPVVLILDVTGQGETAAVLAVGIKQALSQQGVDLAGVIVNRCRSQRHKDIVAAALAAAGIAMLGCLPDSPNLVIPARHLGLQQAQELQATGALAELVAAARDLVSQHIDLAGLLAVARPLSPAVKTKQPPAVPPLGSRIAIAHDAAFGFAYAHVLADWRRGGVAILPFSPLADEAPDKQADAVYLPGGYPELHLPHLAQQQRFMAGLRHAAKGGAWVYGECGGYMALGQAIIDKAGKQHSMAGLLDCVTDFSQPKLHLGYRRLKRLAAVPLPKLARGHEFHYTSTRHAVGDALFQAADKNGESLGAIGLCQGKVFGSYAHIIAADSSAA